ncbi:unnamed protein product [Rhizoctonia solani]|uniref:Uncharacterized protein n=1 Tax=Rhizoctonia solani TaxID=456999 RepID=A0A8H2XYP9_9AGAM|nr:unnamed protein product [Rhizoctonia solani]
MPKASKPTRTTKPPPKPVLSSATKAARRQRVQEYKSAKASALAPAAPRKGPRYHDKDKDDADNENADDDDADDADDANDSDNVEDSNGEDNRKNNEGAYVGPVPYKSACGKFAFIPDEAGENIKHTVLNRPEGDLKRLDKLMELDGPGNRALWKASRYSTVRTVSHHVACNIPKCTYYKLTDEQRVNIKVQVRKSYPILHRYCGDWGLNEMIMRALTNERDLHARIEKAGGPAAWSEKLKMQREAKKAGATGKDKGKAVSKRAPEVTSADAPTNDDQPSLVLESPPRKQKATGAFKDSSRSRKTQQTGLEDL